MMESNRISSPHDYGENTTRKFSTSGLCRGPSKGNVCQPQEFLPIMCGIAAECPIVIIQESVSTFKDQ